MPRASSSLIRPASVSRGGGWVSWPSARIDFVPSASPRRHDGEHALRLARGRLDVLGVVLHVREPEARVLDRAARRLEARVVDVDADGRALAARVVHLGRDGAAPDQLVDLALVLGELLGDLAQRAELAARRADRLVGLLRVLDLRRVGARARRAGAARPYSRSIRPRAAPMRLARERGRVGAHVRDEAVLVEALGGAHRALRPRSAASSTPPAAACSS